MEIEKRQEVQGLRLWADFRLNNILAAASFCLGSAHNHFARDAYGLFSPRTSITSSSVLTSCLNTCMKWHSTYAGLWHLIFPKELFFSFTVGHTIKNRYSFNCTITAILLIIIIIFYYALWTPLSPLKWRWFNLFLSRLVPKYNEYFLHSIKNS